MKWRRIASTALVPRSISATSHFVVASSIMEKEYLQLKISGLKKILLPKLENEVFHLTNQLGYEGIIRKRQIEHNKT